MRMDGQILVMVAASRLLECFPVPASPPRSSGPKLSFAVSIGPAFPSRGHSGQLPANGTGLEPSLITVPGKQEQQFERVYESDVLSSAGAERAAKVLPRSSALRKRT